MFRLVLFAISIIAIIIILLGNMTIVFTNLSQIVKHCFAINSTADYWQNVFKANVTAKSIMTSMLGLMIAFAVYLVIMPLIFFRKYTLSSTGKKSGDYFKNIDDREIKEMVDLLHAKLPKKPTEKNYQLTKQKLLLDVPMNASLQEKLQVVANNMCQHLRISKPIRILTLANIPAGKFEQMDGINTIFINSDLANQSFNQKLAILAHEIAHYYLMTTHRIYFSETNKNEFLTEVCTIYIGFGFLLLEGYQIESNNNNNTFAKVGYISEDVVFDTIIKTAFIRKQNPNWIIKNLSFPLSLMARYKLHPLVKDYKKHMKNQKAGA